MYYSRFRNFRITLPFKYFLSVKDVIIEKLNILCSFVVGQEEMSPAGYHHMEIFITTRNSYTYNSINKNLGIKYSIPVLGPDIDREIAYCMKLDTRVPNGFLLSIGHRKILDQQNFWSKFLHSNSVAEGLAYVRDEKPDIYIKMFPKLQASLLNELGATTTARFKDNWCVPFISFDDDRTDVFIGPSGIGKTNFALSHFNSACHITCRQDFDKLGPTKFDYDGFVVDDLPLYKWDAEEIIALTDKKYLMSINEYGTGIIRAGMPRIICSNDIDLVINPSWPEARRLAIERR